MRAIGFHQFGGREVLEIVDLPDPTPGPREVRIRVAASTINPTDISFRSGARAEQLAAFPAPYVPGMEIAGTIDAVGEGTTWKIGDQVLAIVLPMRNGRGGHSELVVVPEHSVVRVPNSVSVEQAATLPMNGLTVRLALDLLELDEGKTLAVTGAAGAIGGYAIELGVNAGLRVIAVASPRDEALTKSFGAELFVERGDDAAEKVRSLVPNGVDAVIDGAVLGKAILPAIKDGGLIAAVRAFDDPTERDIEIRRVQVSEYAENDVALSGLVELVNENKLTLRVGPTFPLERAIEAFETFEAGGVRGRVVITY